MARQKEEHGKEHEDMYLNVTLGSMEKFSRVGFKLHGQENEVGEVSVGQVTTRSLCIMTV